MSIQNFTAWNLRDNAFPIVPDTAEWFGFPALKAKYKTQIDRSYQQPVRLCILNRGRFGAGKTNSARYFAKQLSEGGAQHLYAGMIPLIVENPKEHKDAFTELSASIMDALQFSRIAAACQQYRANVGRDVAFNNIRQACGSEDVATALADFAEAKTLPMRTYLAGAGSAKDLRELGVAKKLSSMRDFGQALTGILHVVTRSTEGGGGKPTRVVLWIDEMEDLIYFPTKSYLPYTQALREIMDRMPEHFTLFFNFTFSEPEDLPSIENVLGAAIMGRIDEHIIFEPPSKEDIVGYLTDLLTNKQLGAKANPILPFNPNTVGILADHVAAQTPRFVNKVCGKLLRKLTEVRAATTTQAEITEQELADNLPAIVSEVESERG